MDPTNGIAIHKDDGERAQQSKSASTSHTKSQNSSDATGMTEILFLPARARSIILPKQIDMPEPMRKRLLHGSSLWDVVVEHHHRINLHHDYSATNLALAQEIALDFFSSALVSCPMGSVFIDGSLVKKAYSLIQTWPNYVTASVQIRHSVTLVRDCLFRHYGVTEDTVEAESLPMKPREVEASRTRLASRRLVAMWQRLTGSQAGVYEEVAILKEAMKLMVWERDGRKTAAIWREILPHLCSETELKKWILETFHHKKLVEEFHWILQQSIENCVVTEETVKIHDDDKYHPYQLLGYVLKWYYGNEDKLF